MDKKSLNQAEILSYFWDKGGGAVHNYSYRVDSRKVASCMDFLKGSLNIKPGVTRNVKLLDMFFLTYPYTKRGYF